MARVFAPAAFRYNGTDYRYGWQDMPDSLADTLVIAGYVDYNDNEQGKRTEFANMDDFTAWGGATKFGVGYPKIGGMVYYCNGTSVSGVGRLVPSGGDDAPQISAMALANKGIVELGPGAFKLNTPIILQPGSDGNLNGLRPSVKLRGVHPGITIVDTSGMDQALLKVHDTFTITNITNANPCVVTVLENIPETGGTNDGTGNWTTGEARQINGTKITIQTPATGQATDTSAAAVLTMEAINGIGETDIYMKKLTANTFALYSNAALTTAVNTTDTTRWGTFGAGQNVTDYGITWNTGNSWKMRRYYGQYQYNPCIRIVGPVKPSGVDRYQTFGSEISGISFRNTAGAISSNADLNGICIAYEDNLTGTVGADGDSSITENIRFDMCTFHGYQASVLLDDTTNVNFVNTSFEHSNHHAVWFGYNVDIVRFEECRFGDEGFTPGIPLQQVCRLAPVYIGPYATQIPAPGITTSLKFDSCWIMQCHNVTGDLKGDQVIFDNCYFEKARVVSSQSFITLIATGNHFTNFPFQTNLKNGEPVFNDKINWEIHGNESYAVPKFGWANVTHNSSTESSYTRATWFNNRLPVTAPTANQNEKGHIRYNPFSANFGRDHYICLYDDVASGSEGRYGKGFYQFIGADQVAGDDRMYINTAVTGNFYLIIPELYNFYKLTLTGAVTIQNLGSAIDENSSNGMTYLGVNHNSSADRRLFKIKPIRILLIQDATGGRAITLGTDFDSTGFVNGSAATPNQKSLTEWQWTGAKFSLTKQTAWA